MTLKLVNAHDLRQGSFAMIDGAPCVIKNVDISNGALLDITRQRRPFYISIPPIKQDLGAWQ